MELIIERSSSFLPLQEALSGIFGYISLVAWIVLTVPQLVLNYKKKNSDGVSLAFLAVWVGGDIANLSGALWASLVPTVVTLAIYFCISNVALTSQSIYYKYWRNENKSISTNTGTVHNANFDENTALLPNTQSLSSPDSSESSRPADSNLRSQMSNFFLNIFFILTVIFSGTLVWIISYYTGIWTPTPAPTQPPSDNTKENTPLGALILGYISAILYLIARIPQIIKNYRKKSCEGLSLLLFLFSLMGNFTQGLSILCHSLQKSYLITNLPWLIGSLGTMSEDVLIFLQFRKYSKTKGELKRDVTAPLLEAQDFTL